MSDRLPCGSRPRAEAGATRRSTSARSGARTWTRKKSAPCSGSRSTAPGSTSTWPTVATAPSIGIAAARARSTYSAAATRASSRPSIGSVQGVTGAPFERGARRARFRRCPSRARAGRVRAPAPALVDVHLQEAFGQLLAVGEGRAPDATPLLVAEHHHDAAPRAFHRLDRRDDAERTVELAPVRNGVEMRAGPDARVGAAPDQVGGAVHLDSEDLLLQPLRHQLVCGWSSPDVPATPDRADAAADGVRARRAARGSSSRDHPFWT